MSDYRDRSAQSNQMTRERKRYDHTERNPDKRHNKCLLEDEPSGCMTLRPKFLLLDQDTAISYYGDGFGLLHSKSDLLFDQDDALHLRLVSTLVLLCNVEARRLWFFSRTDEASEDVSSKYAPLTDDLERV